MIEPIDLSLFPITVQISEQGNLSIAGIDLQTLAAKYQTPLYVYDGATVRHQVAWLQRLLREHYPAKSAVAYASKAYFSAGLAKQLIGMGVELDVNSVGEMSLAFQADFSPSAVHLHGNNKSQAELVAALGWGIQAVVVDSLDELEFVQKLAEKKNQKVRVWLRITPDIHVDTHPSIQTSHTDSKFGLHIEDGQAAEAIRQARSSRWLDLVGLHTHLGSKLVVTEPYLEAIRMLFHLAESENFVPQELSPGGGWGVRYVEKDPADDPTEWVKGICETVRSECDRLNWPLPKLILEPGRWVIARSGVAVYSVGAQKRTPTGTLIAAVDGGLADNPRVALYQAHYSARRVRDPLEPSTRPTRIVGRFCESGDILIDSVELPVLQRGDLIAIPASGAYQVSMASNYNYASRPAVLWLEDGRVEVLQPREQPEEIRWWLGPESQ